MEEKKISFTDSQKDAINTKNKNLLVSAAAGSGKTATLTERIISSLTNPDSPADISKMLVVTFTRASAADLRQKIFKALSKALAMEPQNKHLASQLIKLENANISTIDSFYYDILREFSSFAGIPQSFRIADTAEAKLLAREIMEKTVSDFYAKDIESFSRFAECFVNIRGTANLPEVLLDLYSHISSYPEGVEFLRRSAESCFAGSERDFFDTDFGQVLKNDTKEKIKYYLVQLEDSVPGLSADEDLSSKYLPSFLYDITYCQTVLSALDSKDGYSETKTVLASYSPIKLGRVSHSTEYSTEQRERRAKINKSLSAIAQKAFSLSSEEISRVMKDTAKITLILHDVLSEFEKAFLDEKLSRSILEFNDIRRFVMKLFVDENNEPTETAKLVSQRYTDIYIDEYQDVDRVQDMIFSAISDGHNRFMVGDIKQSIYGFRGAEPSVFAGYRKDFPQHGTENAKASSSESIFMSENFRCDENVIRFTNRVCSYLFGLVSDSIGYTKEDDLVFSKKKPSDDYSSPEVVLGIIVPPTDEDSDYKPIAENNRAAEARYIAGEILKLLRGKRKADGEKITAGDIAVMFRSSKMKNYLCAAFDEAGIKYCGAEDKKYFEDPSVLLVLSFLNVIDNPHRDIHLAATLRSPLFSFTLEELIILRRYCDSSYSLFDCLFEYSENESDTLAKKCSEFCAELDIQRDMTLSLPVDKLLARVYAMRRFTDAGLSTSENLTLLYEYARRFEAGSFKGLYNFIEYVNKLIADGASFEMEDSAESEDKVTLMTVHHSKGLEYPVCFLCGASTEFNTNEFNDSLLFESGIGAAMKLSDNSGFARINTPLREAIASKITLNNAEEEIRVLYVALTRARERLYITASSKKSADDILSAAEVRKKYSSKYMLMSCKSYLDWILTALSGTDLEGLCRIDFAEADKIELTPSAEAQTEDEREHVCDNELALRLLESFRFEYPYRELSRLPAKLSVSRLSPDVLDIDSDAEPLFEETKKADVPYILTEKGKRPPSAAERGTATHLFLQFCDFKRCEKTGVAEELEMLIEGRYLPAESKELIFFDELERFFSSELFSKIKTAKRIIREQRFNILLPPSMFSKDKEFIESIGDEMLAVQGVIDLVIIDENDKLCLYDYKTDRLSQRELCNDTALSVKMKERHSEQLNYYKLAIKELFGRECDSAEIYSTCAARTVAV